MFNRINIFLIICDNNFIRKNKKFTKEENKLYRISRLRLNLIFIYLLFILFKYLKKTIYII